MLARELRDLGYDRVSVENGRVSFQGDDSAIARCNLWLRTADRVLIKVAEFPAGDFEELFQGTLRIGWEDILPVSANMHVIGKSVKSKLHSVPACQSIVKKALIEAMKRRYRRERFEESGVEYRIEVSLLKDIATLTVDTSGHGLHKRGYRRQAGEAPIKETLAAGLVLLSGWTPERILADPFCGSGTIAIEAALIGKNRAPGLHRRFSAEEWPAIPRVVWKQAREQAAAVETTNDFVVLASDAEALALRLTQQNARAAGVQDHVRFEQKDVSDFHSDQKNGVIVCNPPYGERLIGPPRHTEDLYRALGKVFSTLEDWSLYVLSAHPHFEAALGRKAQRKRKLYNGNILCYYYQYPRSGVRTGAQGSRSYHP